MELKDRSEENSKEDKLLESGEDNKSKDDKMFKKKINDDEFPIITKKRNI